MSKLVGRVLVVLAFGWVGSTSAALMAPVLADGKEWLQPIDFINTSWNSIAGVCDTTSGVCTGSLNGNDLTGWTWASVDDANRLFNSFLPGDPMGPGSDVFIAPLNTIFIDFTDAGFLAATGYYAGGSSVIGFSRETEDKYGYAYTPWMSSGAYPPWGLADRAITDWWDAKDFTSVAMGGWFFRELEVTTQVPAPATVTLLGLGLASLGFIRRKRRLST